MPSEVHSKEYGLTICSVHLERSGAVCIMVVHESKVRHEEKRPDKEGKYLYVAHASCK